MKCSLILMGVWRDPSWIAAINRRNGRGSNTVAGKHIRKELAADAAKKMGLRF
jgi:hypothetical protein